MPPVSCLTGARIGLNLGCGFGDLSKAGENAFILDNRIHKLEQVKFDYTSGDYMKPWKFTDTEGRLDLVFTPFKDRTATTNLAVITSEVHQMFGRYNGTLITDDGEEDTDQGSDRLCRRTSCQVVDACKRPGNLLNPSPCRNTRARR